MNILLLGGSGMLGTDCAEVLSNYYEVIAPSKKEMDIISWDIVIEKLQQLAPDIILNCAGFTDVDACETEDFAVRKINVEGPRNLAQGSARFNCRIVHISTDYVFNGEKSIPQLYFEDDPVDPISAYAQSKMQSEVAIRENSPNYIIIRTSWLYGFNGDDFIDSILYNAKKLKNKPLKVVDDQIGSPTWTHSVALQIKELLKTDAKGTFHATSEGYCSRFELAKYILKKLKIKTPVEPCKMSDFPQVAKRPANCILENRLLKNMGLNIMPEWKKDIDRYLKKFGKALIKKANARK
ncbi:MAG: dTDP-4-dehydrorhamnose reductase [Deltaproteobacteria bacterium]|nr:dTDP-4-dehydrorhamnose reductase [Deltaproteobacteria bacterium]MBW1912209.1 dTDP-4-dehydrorhamnose reductase [Deltaproteobacteria bacterium]